MVFDTGALLAIEFGKMTDVLSTANALDLPIRFSGGALAQAWRGGPRRARLSALLKQRGVTVIALDADEARRVGEFIAQTRTARADVVDAHAAFLARKTQSLVYTSDVEDLASYGVPPTLIRRV